MEPLLYAVSDLMPTLLFPFILHCSLDRPPISSQAEIRMHFLQDVVETSGQDVSLGFWKYLSHPSPVFLAENIGLSAANVLT